MPSLIGLMLFYGILNLGLGIFAYFNSGSWVSLLAGGIAGVIVIGCAALAKTMPRVAYITATVVALAIAIRFLPKFLGERQWYPAGIEVIASLILAVALVGAHFSAMARRKRESA